jgi:hypothetical protein
MFQPFLRASPILWLRERHPTSLRASSGVRERPVFKIANNLSFCDIGPRLLNQGMLFKPFRFTFPQSGADGFPIVAHDLSQNISYGFHDWILGFLPEK